MSQNGDVLQPEIDSARNTLRKRWELASVLNFFKVFEPVIESNLKVSAEEIETALIIPNKCLAQLHISLLKGIPPVSKNLKDPDVWVVALSKKLVMWWPWVGEGKCPLTAAKGAEMVTYKELDATSRLTILKALCEIRADQQDVVSYINDAVKSKNELSTFRKTNIGEDGKGTSYWLDGNEIIGLRLYKEVNTFLKKGSSTTINCQLETLATNLEEFQKVVDDFSSSKSKLEVAVSAVIVTEAIPVLQKALKKQQRALQKKKNEERIMNNFCRSGITRSCRTRTPISYTFDEYDKAIDEALRETKKMKTSDKQKSEKKEIVEGEDPKQDQPTNGESSESDYESHKFEIVDDSEDGGEESDKNDANKETANYSSKYGRMQTRDEQRRKRKENVANEDSVQDVGEPTESDSKSSELEVEYVSDDSDEEQDESDDDYKDNSNNGIMENDSCAKKTMKSKKLTVDDDHSFYQIENFGTKKRLGQRPSRNAALMSAIVPDSEDDISSENSDR
uniref:DDT domain-containing protein DDR4 n=1 Tax=Erigeron canadensis TaxID=72917 RepID=UPI001CB98300|nr:DDT domain-containing protein DDR4 [Erigeron canadensis]